MEGLKPPTLDATGSLVSGKDIEKILPPKQTDATYTARPTAT
jgi:hypothetical protein